MKVAILGLGLIGGSIAAALKKRNKKVTIVAYDQDITALKYAQKIGIINYYECAVKSAVTSANIIVVATLIAGYGKIFVSLAKCITGAQIITDVCSVKGAVIKIAKRELKQNISQFVPAHPIAGSEKRGVENLQADLFISHPVILTPLLKTKTEVTREIAGFWKNLGAVVTSMTAVQHDMILAATSHLPHVLSYAYMGMFFRRKSITKYSAGGFKDLTRIAVSDTKLWYGIFRANSKALLIEIENFKKRLGVLEKVIRQREKSNMNIILFGFKNSGKTTLGRLLAAKLKLDFIDTDDLLAKHYCEKHKKSLSTQQIYKIIGEIKFRDLEKQVIWSLAHTEYTVIATGGGSVMNPESVKILKSIGKLVYLKAPKQLVKERIFAGRLPAFLDAKDKANSFEKIYADREATYDAIADITVEITAKTNEEIIREIELEVGKYGK